MPAFPCFNWCSGLPREALSLTHHGDQPRRQLRVNIEAVERLGPVLVYPQHFCRALLPSPRLAVRQAWAPENARWVKVLVATRSWHSYRALRFYGSALDNVGYHPDDPRQGIGFHHLILPFCCACRLLVSTMVARGRLRSA